MVKTITNQRCLESEERTALSFIMGLRQHYAREIGKNISYSSEELHNLMDSTLKKIKNHKLTPVDLAYIFNPPKSNEEPWGYIQNQIERNKIKRYPWEDILEISLTREILQLKNKGKTIDETYMIILKDVRVQRFIEEHKDESPKIMENLRTSVNARFGESNTAKKIEEEVFA